MKIAWNMLLPVKPLDSMLTSFGPIKFWASCKENLHIRELEEKRGKESQYFPFFFWVVLSTCSLKKKKKKKS